MSAENMIETLLSKKEIFQKKQPSQPEPSTQKQKVLYICQVFESLLIYV